MEKDVEQSDLAYFKAHQGICLQELWQITRNINKDSQYVDRNSNLAFTDKVSPNIHNGSIVTLILTACRIVVM
jgi:hypothetical protein